MGKRGGRKKTRQSNGKERLVLIKTTNYGLRYRIRKGGKERTFDLMSGTVRDV